MEELEKFRAGLSLQIADEGAEKIPEKYRKEKLWKTIY